MYGTFLGLMHVSVLFSVRKRAPFSDGYCGWVSVTLSSIMNKDWSILNWNIRGLNDPKKWTAIRNKIEESNCAILCIQETKREVIDSRFLQNFCPRRLSKFEYLPS